MELIFGGAYQGKTQYAAQKYGLTDADIFTCEDLDLDPDARCIRHLERFARACTEAGLDAREEFARRSPRACCAAGPVGADLARGIRQASFQPRGAGGHRHENFLRAAAGGQAMNRLVLLRHGRTEGTERHLYYGATDLPLLEDGVRELKDAARRGVYPAPGGFSFVTTGMRRTTETLRAIYGDVPFSVLEDLREVNFGIFEMKSYEEVKSEPSYQAWLAGDWFSNTPPQGESFRASEARIARGLEQLLAREEDTICICHGGTILTAMQRLFPEEGKDGYAWQPKPGFGYTIDLVNRAYLPISG